MVRTRSSKEFNVDTDEKQNEQPAIVQQEEAKVEENKEEPMVEEPSTKEKPPVTEEDVEKAKELFTEGKRNFICGSVAEAGEALAQTCRVYARHFGELDYECADPYYFYGRTLLELARKEPDVVGNAVEGTCLDSIDKEGGEEATGDSATGNANGSFQVVDDTEESGAEIPTEDQIREQVLDALDENAAELDKEAEKKNDTGADETAAGEKSTDEDAGADAGEDMQEDETPVVEEVDETEESDGEKENSEPVVGEETAEEVSNLQLAWEMLDLARVILEKRTDEPSRQRLADVRLALGEQAMEDEQFDKAISEFDAALQIQKEVMPSDDRRISLSYYNIGVAYNAVEKYEEAAESFKRAIFVLEMRRANLNMKLNESKKEEGDGKEKTEMESEITELDALIGDIQGRVQDCVESRAQTDAAKPALDELTGTKSGEKEESALAADEKATTDVSHLLRKSVKRVSEGTDGNELSKKAKLDTEGTNGSNGHEVENGKVEVAANGDGKDNE